jgi:hypothetical protein
MNIVINVLAVIGFLALALPADYGELNHFLHDWKEVSPGILQKIVKYPG